MHACSTHNNHDPDPKCAGPIAPPAEVARCLGRHVPLRLSARGNPRSGRASDDRGAETSPGGPLPRHTRGRARRRRPPRTRPPVIVVDASAFLEVLLRTPAAEAVETSLFARPRQTLHAPHLLDVEVTHALRRYAAAGDIDRERGRAALTDFADFPVRRYPHTILLPRVWELRSNFTAYDAVYVALAEALDASLLTRDHRLATAAKRHVGVELA